MSRFNRLLRTDGLRVLPSFLVHGHGSGLTHPFIPIQRSCQRTCNRFLDFYQVGNKGAIEKERARIADEMSRGYFADMSEFKQNGGKIAVANKILIPSVAAVKFPDIQVEAPSGSFLKLPVSCSLDQASQSPTSAVPKVTLMCLSFRASSQAMVSSWSMPFCDAFHDADNIHVYEVSFIDSWLLCRKPIKNLLLRVMRNSKNVEGEIAIKRRVVYSFGDNYYFRKNLRILNLLTGYIYLLDRFGRVRWQGFGSASPEELSSLKSCTTLLLGEKYGGERYGDRVSTPVTGVSQYLNKLAFSLSPNVEIFLSLDKFITGSDDNSGADKFWNLLASLIVCLRFHLSTERLRE